MTHRASWTVLVILGLSASCGGRTPLESVDDPDLNAGTARDHDRTSTATACDAIMIDDMEGKGPPLPPGTGSFWWARGLGNWSYDLGGRDATAEDIVPPRGDSNKALRLDSYTGDGLRCQLDHPSNRAVDLSMYRGITFWARLPSPRGQLVVTTEALAYSGIDPFAQQVAVSDTWQAIEMPFADFRQVGSENRFDAKVLSDLHFTVVGAQSFDLWIDDLALTCESRR